MSMNRVRAMNRSRGLRLGGLVAALVLVGGLLTGCQLAPDVALGGQVTTTGGATVGQVTITVYSDATTQAAQTTTDGSGQYEINDTDLTPGTYRIEVGGQWYGPGASDYATAADVTITDTPTRLNVILTDASDVTGTVVDPTTHDPMGNTVLAAFDTNGHAVGIATTNGDGTFDLGAPGGSTVTIKILDTGSTLVTLGGTTPTQITTTAGDTTDIGTLTVNHPTHIAAGVDYQACEVWADGTVTCRGENYNGWGLLGDGTANSSSVPVQVKGVGGTGVLTGVTAISAGEYHTCALRSDTTVVCWGGNLYGQLGDGTDTASRVPVQVKDLAGAGDLTGVTAISAGYGHTCALLSDQTVACWGFSDGGQLGSGMGSTKVPYLVKGVGGTGTLSGVTAITAGEGVSSSQTCALKTDHTMVCWGSNSSGQLGRGGDHYDSNYPVQVKGVGGTGTLTDIVAITAGADVTCAANSQGAVFCWGDNAHGKLGNGSTSDSDYPVQVKGVGGTGTLTGVTQLDAAYDDVCGLKSDGTMACWGRNDRGQLGDGTTSDSNVPVVVTGVGGTGTLTGVTDMGMSVVFTCALRADHQEVCWGSSTDVVDSSVPTNTAVGPYAMTITP